MIVNEDNSITWDLSAPVERSDAAYRAMYFACSREMARARMNNVNLPGNELANQLGAFIALITDAEKQEELWKMFEDMVHERTKDVFDWQRVARIRGECAEEVMMYVMEWFARFWSVSEVVRIDFVRSEANG